MSNQHPLPPPKSSFSADSLDQHFLSRSRGHSFAGPETTGYLRLSVTGHPFMDLKDLAPISNWNEVQVLVQTLPHLQKLQSFYLQELECL